MRYVVTSKNWDGEATIFDNLDQVKDYFHSRRRDYGDSVSELELMEVYELGPQRAVTIVPIQIEIGGNLTVE